MLPEQPISISVDFEADGSPIPVPITVDLIDNDEVDGDRSVTLELEIPEDSIEIAKLGKKSKLHVVIRIKNDDSKYTCFSSVFKSYCWALSLVSLNTKILNCKVTRAHAVCSNWSDCYNVGG